jgi:hypothetical protein
MAASHRLSLLLKNPSSELTTGARIAANVGNGPFFSFAAMGSDRP